MSEHAQFEPAEQQAIRDAIDIRRQALPPADLARVEAILDNWARLKSEHEQREFLRARLHAIGLPLES